MVEGYIGALSILRLRELSHPSGPLLRKLQRDAAGTYQREGAGRSVESLRGGIPDPAGGKARRGGEEASGEEA